MNKNQSTVWKDLFIASFAPLAWGTTYFVAGTLLPKDRPFLIAFLRAFPAGLILFCLYPRIPRGAWWWKSFILGALNIGLFFAGVFITAIRLPGGVAACLLAVQPILVLFFARLLLKEKSTYRALSAALIGALGVSFVVLGPKAELDSLGLLAGLLSYASMSLGTVLTRVWGRPVPLISFTSWQLLSGGLVLIPILFIFEGRPNFDFTFTGWGAIGYLGCFNTALAYLAWFHGIEKLHNRVNYLLLLNPLVALVLGIFFAHQNMSFIQFIGVILVAMGIFLGQQRK